MRSRKELAALLVVIAAAVCFRALFAGVIIGWDRDPIGDEIDYDALATSLADGNGYTIAGHPISRRPPLYPIVLAAPYAAAGPSIAAGRVEQVLLGAVVVFLVLLVARRYFGSAAAWGAAILCACNPFLIFISGYLLTENLYTVLVLLLLLLAPQPQAAARSYGVAAGVGLLAALAGLARPTILPFFLWLVAAVVLVRAVPAKRRMLSGLVVAAVFVATLTPWAARNHAHFDRWIFFTSHGGITFYQGNNEKVLEVPQYHGAVAPLYALPGYDELVEMRPAAKDSAAWAKGRAFLAQNKRYVPLLVWRKFARFWRFQSDVGLSGVKSGWWWNKDSVLGGLASSLDVGFAYAMVVIPLFVVGLFLTRREWRRLTFLYGIVVMHTLVSLIFHGSLRMRIPVEPVMAMFAAEAARILFVRARARRQSSATVPRET